MVSHIPAQREKIDAEISKLDKKYNYDLLFAPIVQSKEHFDTYLKVSPFYQNVRKEGVTYA